jgi:arylsulfatase A-like enzyme
MKCVRGLGVSVLAVLLGGCPGAPRQVVYDLAARTAAAERWSSREVVLFGTPAAEPYQSDGFYREAPGASGDAFVWSKAESEVALRLQRMVPRLAVLDLAPFRGVRAQAVEVLLNDVMVARFALNDTRHRYRLDLPAGVQRKGDNRLRFRFAATAAPAAGDATSTDKRELAAAFYAMVLGEEGDVGLEDLLTPDAPRPFEAGEGGKGVPALTLVGPSVVRFALRMPAGGELRFTPVLHPGALAAAAGATFRVLCQEANGGERELWSRVLRPREAKVEEQTVRLPGAAGDIVRLGLAVGPATTTTDRFAWGVFKAPRVLGRGAALSLPPAPLAPLDEARADPLRKSLAGSNVVLVILDAARAQSFSAYGAPRATTPQIDALARDGVLFERAFTPAVYTLGAMSSVWTSQYPDRHHSEVSFAARLPKSRLTLAEMLTAHGVHTAGFVANAVAGSGFGFDRGFSEFHEVFRDLGSRGDVFRQVLPEWLRKNKDRRFFLYVHFREPHFPYDPEPPFDTRFGPDGPIPKAARRDQAWITDVNQGRRPLAASEREHLGRLFDGNLAFADEEVGALVREIGATGLAEKTLVVVAADHGEGLFEHGWIGHNVQLFEESVHVPLVVRFPSGKGPKGQKIGALVDLLDLAPTIADVFGLRGQGGSREQFQGRSLLPVVAGAPGKPVVLSRTVWDRPRYGLRDERYKFLYDTRTGESALYDVVADPKETKDMAAAEPVRAAYYRESLHFWMKTLTRGAAGGGEEARLTPEQCANLKALGYITADCPP